ncbi:MAG TPA: cysteine--tRNA ligase [Candidatus Paceibacterota bacterium]
MSLFLYNTLSRKKESFRPINGKVVGMYNCGPTVYNYAHIGNLRAYIFADTLRRTLEWNGYKVKQVMNITDVGHLTSDADFGEDKMTKALLREGKPMTLEAMKEVADKYTKAFVSDLKSLNIQLPTDMPRASEHIAEDIEIIKKLEEKGFAYKISDGIYFDTAKFPDYGKLGGVNKASLKEGARVEVNPEKKNPADFNLWKFNNELGWDSPWGTPASPSGRGFPGWHIECSAMSRKYLGQPFDIHTGGVDHIGTHHNNEIAQSEAAFDVPLVNVWMHNEHLNMAGDPNAAKGSAGQVKMAKSGDNFLTLNSIVEKGFSPLAYRYYLLGANYRTPMMFSWEALEAAKNTIKNLIMFLAGMPEGRKVNSDYEKMFTEAINDDLNTSDALSVLWELLRDEKVEPADRRATALKFDEVLGLNLVELIKKQLEPITVPSDVQKLIKDRETARAEKDFKRSDELREEIKKFGFEVKDTEDGQKVTKI